MTGEVTEQLARPSTACAADDPAALTLARVAKSFGGVDVLRDVDMNVRSGTVHFLIGPNGAGKTTLFNIISGFTKCDSGTVTLYGDDVTGMSARRLARKRMARTFQNLQLFESLTVAENIMVSLHSRMHVGLTASLLGLVGPQEHREYERANEWLERFNLGRYAKSRPADLSYGDRRLIEVVRAMAREPQILLLDEPAAGLAVDARVRLLEVLRGLRETGLTMVLVEHDMRFGMSIADDVTVLDAGTRIAHGSPAEIQEDPAVIKAYLGHGAAVTHD